MSEEKKPKKDLRARLGRTIAPNTQGAAPIAAPGGVIAPPPSAAVAPPPAARGDAPPPPVAAPAAQPAIAAPPAMASRSAFGGADIAPPPFARPAAAPTPAEAPKPRRSADPFAAGPSSQGPQEVRLVIDERPVDDSEIGRRQRGRTLIVVSVCIALGLVIGAGAGSMNGRRTLYNITVRDGHEIYNAVDTASRTVLDAQQHVEAIATSAGGAGGAPSVNYTEIAALVALQNPLTANAFSRKNYGAFQPGAVDDLFSYYQNVQRLWEHFQHLNAITAAPRRPVLDETAALTGEAATAQFVAVLVAAPEDDGGGYVGQLAFAEPAMGADGQPTAQILARGTRTGAGRPFDRWAPGVELGSTPTHVLLIDGAGSAGVLGERLGAFRGFVLALTEIRELMTQTIEIQGRLTTSLGDIARLEEVTAF